MGSDTLEKPSHQRTSTRKLRLFLDKAKLLFQQLLARSGKPWILFPDLALGLLSLLWTLICGLLLVVWTHIIPGNMKKHLQQVNWAQFGFKVFSRVLLACYGWIGVALCYSGPWGPGGQWPLQSVKTAPQYRPHIAKCDISSSYHTATLLTSSSYFADFEGGALCKIQATNLYAPILDNNDGHGYCSTRAALLKAMSEGGRHGFDAPYMPRGKSVT